MMLRTLGKRLPISGQYCYTLEPVCCTATLTPANTGSPSVQGHRQLHQRSSKDSANKKKIYFSKLSEGEGLNLLRRCLNDRNAVFIRSLTNKPVKVVNPLKNLQILKPYDGNISSAQFKKKLEFDTRAQYSEFPVKEKASKVTIAYIFTLCTIAIVVFNLK